MGVQSSKAVPGDHLEKMRDAAHTTDAEVLKRSSKSRESNSGTFDSTYEKHESMDIKDANSARDSSLFRDSFRITTSEDKNRGEPKPEESEFSKQQVPAYRLRRPSKLQVDIERAHDAGKRMLEDISDLITSSSS